MKSDFIHFFFFYDFIHVCMYIAPGQGLTTPWGQHFDVNRNNLKSDFILFFMILYMYVGYPESL